MTQLHTCITSEWTARDWYLSSHLSLFSKSETLPSSRRTCLQHSVFDFTNQTNNHCQNDSGEHQSWTDCNCNYFHLRNWCKWKISHMRAQGSSVYRCLIINCGFLLHPAYYRRNFLGRIIKLIMVKQKNLEWWLQLWYNVVNGTINEKQKALDYGKENYLLPSFVVESRVRCQQFLGKCFSRQARKPLTVLR